MASVFDRYYRALGVSASASERDIKSAYRKLAMRYHPDKNKAPEARARFLEVTEAYQILLKRDEYASILISALRTTEASRRAAAEARLRKEREEMARTNQQYAEMEYAAFMRSPLYRTAMWLNTAYDYVFLAIAIGMVIAPFYSYFYMPIVDEYGNEEHVFHPLALLVGLFFLGGIWYFLFRPQRSKS